ncbi:MAG: 4-(cytidine 5'-diphospho)-2-C-methyl-D-erythritol kinase [Syntrophothermus sp.]
MIVDPNAKINLGLHVHDKGEDGFHNIETVFCPVDLTDMLEVVPSADDVFLFQSTGLPIPGDTAGNLCVKAYELMKKDHDLPAVKIHLHKTIPMGAGLGGGSADAAFMIRALNQLFGLDLADEKMMEYTRQLGSDCTFFIRNKVSFGYGRGDQLEPITLDLSGYTIVVIVPLVHINTAKAYSMIDEQRAADPAGIFRDVHKACHLINVVESGPASWSSLVQNDFEMPVFSAHPLLAGIKQQMYDHGAVYASMSGSGSAIYGVFPREMEIEKDAFGDYFFWQGKMLE